MTTTYTSAYLDVPGYLRAATNQETASLLGLNTTLGGATILAAGAVSLPVAASAGWSVGPIWLLDGPWSEVAQVTGLADSTHLTLAAPGTLWPHTPGISVSQGGAAGSLAETILRASAWMEGYCQQGTAADRSLYALSRTEQWGMPGTRAWIDRDAIAVVRPGHFPVQSVSALTLDQGEAGAFALDIAQVRLPSDGRLIEAPLLAGIDPLLALSRSHRAWISVTYVGGITPGALPYDLAQACVWITSELLAERRNPTGAARIRQGKFELQARPWGDRSGDSTLLLQAKAALEPYRAQAI
ncbi:MAG TPA: hypothetical protein VJO13_16175 [Ktedonobacterales bacterium]|nr:hypothetical protein [Ktedonobacterales bacterium]